MSQLFTPLNFLRSQADLLRDTSLTYRGERTAKAIPGDRITLRTGEVFDIAGEDASDHDYTTQGGVKLYAVATSIPALDALEFDTVAELLADTQLGYSSPAPWRVVAGDIVKAGGHRYQVVPLAAIYHVTNANGVLLLVLPGEGGAYNTAAFGATQAALQTALNVAANARVILSGDYTATSSVTMSTAGVKVVGRGGSLTGTAAVTNGALVVSATGVSLEDFSVTVQNATADCIIASSLLADGFEAIRIKTRGGRYGISANKNSNLLFEGCDIAGCYRQGIRCHNFATWVNGVGQTVPPALQEFTNIRVLGCKIDLSHQAAVDGTTANPCVLIRGGFDQSTLTHYPITNVKMAGNTFISPLSPANNAAECAEVRFCRGGTFIGNHGINGSMLVSVASSDGFAVSVNVADGQSKYAIEVAGTHEHYDSTTTTYYGVRGCFGNTVTANTIDGRERLDYAVGAQGIIASTDLVVANNVIRGIRLYGVLVYEVWNRVDITGNTVIYSTNVTDQRAIWVVECENLVMSGNILRGGGVAEQALRLTGVRNGVVSGNSTGGFLINDILITQGVAGTNDLEVRGNTFGSGLLMNTLATSGTMGARISFVGNAGYRRTNVDRIDILDLASMVIDAVGVGTPEGAVTAGAGSIFRNRSGTAGLTLYRKTGATSTGWKELGAYGTWTPTLRDNSGNLATLTTAYGQYAVSGNLVTVMGRVLVSSLGSMTGTAVYIGGLPVPINAAGLGSGFVGQAAGLSITSGQSVGIRANQPDTHLRLTIWNATTGTGFLDVANLTSAADLWFTATYHI